MAELELEIDEVWKKFQLNLTLHLMGRQDEADLVLAQFIEDNKEFWAYQIGDLYAFRGNADKAFEWLEIARAQRDPGFSWLLTDDFLYTLHSDPRWGPMVESVGLGEAWAAMQKHNEDGD